MDVPVFNEPDVAELLNNVASLVECPICYTTIRTIPVRSCDRGHPVCQSCFNQMNSCGICRLAYIGDCENNVATRLVNMMPFNCKNAEWGCPNRYLLVNLEAHKNVCQYQKVDCNICNAEISLNDYNDHMTRFHTHHFYAMRQVQYDALIMFPIRPWAKCVRLEATGDITYFLHVKPLECKIRGHCQLGNRYHFALFVSCNKTLVAEGTRAEVDYCYASRMTAQSTRVIFRKPILTLTQYKKIKDETNTDVFEKLFKIVAPGDIQRLKVSFKILNNDA